ncbi:MAG: N-acyl-D-amino-acid deacylase family protein [bacterium]
MYSVLIRGGKVVDGSGQAAFRADVAVQDDRIVEVGVGLSGPAEKIIDADGLVVAPGFIDIHSHSDGTIFDHPLSDSKLLQGVTSEVIGNCGIGAFPVKAKYKEELIHYMEIHEFTFPSAGVSWEDFDQYVDVLAGLGLGPNLLPLVAHGNLRGAVMGFDDREPTAAEQAEMEQLLAAALERGAWGMSTGLIYPPGSFAQTEELISLSRILAQYKAIFTSHIRGESGTLRQSLEEVIRIGRESGARIEISHLKAMGKPQWGLGKECLKRLEAARTEGVDIAADQYPYEASSTSLTALVPQWAHSGGVGELLRRLESPELSHRIKEEIAREMSVRGGPERVQVAGVASAKNAKVASGKTIAQLAELWSMSPVDTVIRLILEEDGAVGAVYFSMSEEDMKAILADSHVAVGSDGRGMKAETDSGKATHPRSYGTFPRVIGRFVREGVLPLERAVYKMTGLPAERLRLSNRGFIRPGYAADVTVFDPVTVADQADFANPHQYPVGIEYVLVNGQLAAKDGRLTGQAAGRVLRKRL